MKILNMSLLGVVWLTAVLLLMLTLYNSKTDEVYPEKVTKPIVVQLPPGMDEVAFIKNWIELSDEEESTFPELKEPTLLPIPDSIEPHLTWQDVNERVSILESARKLGRGDKKVMYIGDTAILIVSNTNLSASTFFKRWTQTLKRKGLSFTGTQLWVTVVGNNSLIEKTHHCTRWGAH